ncbi:hypothetical protein DFP72DRAFT_1067255 [Ephemerocybe angulata]|uniref:Uncharacterized protein n=1 Tax=Ephemerocybe angulata TaxID=980116 RepID=A0A8H6M9D2_9AGAR|nr:hypothetical protein DFP72DRAFT_1067255 [Tulosesus angulatus]
MVFTLKNIRSSVVSIKRISASLSSKPSKKDGSSAQDSDSSSQIAEPEIYDHLFRSVLHATRRIAGSSQEEIVPPGPRAGLDQAHQAHPTGDKWPEYHEYIKAAIQCSEVQIHESNAKLLVRSELNWEDSKVITHLAQYLISLATVEGDGQKADIDAIASFSKQVSRQLDDPSMPFNRFQHRFTVLLLEEFVSSWDKSFSVSNNLATLIGAALKYGTLSGADVLACLCTLMAKSTPLTCVENAEAICQLLKNSGEAFWNIISALPTGLNKGIEESCGALLRDLMDQSSKRVEFEHLERLKKSAHDAIVNEAA